MGLLNRQNSANRLLSRSSSAASGARLSRLGRDTVFKRGSNLNGTLPAEEKTRQTKGAARPFTKKKDSACMAATLDLASQIGLSIEGGRTNMSSDTVIADVAAANKKYLDQHTDDNCNSDDELDESEQMQAEAMNKLLFEKLAAMNRMLLEKWNEDEKQDYAVNGEVLDQAIVERRLDIVKGFAEHLRKLGRNRAALLSRLAEPIAEEHWVLDPAYHKQMVSAFQNMCMLVNSLPEIATAARHCMSSATGYDLPVNEDMSDSDKMTDLDRKARQIAQMERLVHEVEQILEDFPDKQLK